MLSCHNLRAIRGDRLLYDHLGFSLKSGEILALRGANGSGKTTLLRQLAGLLPPDAGAIEWHSQSIRNNAGYLREMLYIGHHNAIKPELTVYDNVQYWAALRGTQMLAPAAMQFFGLWPMMDMCVSQLSAGWQRRVALARLLAIPCAVWLLDEPTANLDAEGVKMLEGLIRTRTRQNGIVIFSSHSDEIAADAPCLHLDDFSGFYSGDSLLHAL